jgi:dihydroorotate dehydrogenase (NAD+) catalytic subunit
MSSDDLPRPVAHWRPVVLSSGKRELTLDPPWTNSSGSLGFSTETASLIELSRLGGFITNPISLGRRTPAGGPRFLPTEGGFVLHTGLPNPGLRGIIRRHQSRWRTMACPVILHLISQSTHETAEMVEMIESIEHIDGVEVGVQGDDPTTVAHLVAAAAAHELPVLARLPFGAGAQLAWAALEAGAAGISFAPPRAMILGPGGTFVRGRLYGPAVFPMALEMIRRIRGAGVEAPLVAAGGVYRRDDLQAMFAAGASGVQLDSLLWTEPEAVLIDEQED